MTECSSSSTFSLNAGGTITRMPHIKQSFCTVSSVLSLQYGFNSIPTSDGQPYLVNLTTWLNIGSRLVAIHNSFSVTGNLSN